MKILYICTYYHRAMIFRDSMDRLIQRGHDVRAFNAVANNSPIDEKYEPIMDNLVVHSECFNKYDRFIYFSKQKKIYNSLVSSYDTNSFDLLHSHTLFNGGYVAYKLYKKFGTPYIVTIRNTDLNVFLRFPFFKTIANKIVKDAAGIQFLSPSYQKSFIEKVIKEEEKNQIIKKSKIIFNGLEEFWLNNIAMPKNINTKNKIKILCVGKIDRNKNITTTVKAIELLNNQGLNVDLTIVGPIIVEDLVRDLKKNSFVQILPFMKKEELIEIYKVHDIYVMPSLMETFGRVYAEAMSQGLPVIYSRNQGFDEIFPEGHVGYSVSSLNENEIAEKIKKVINNYSTISKSCIYESKRFDWDSISKDIEGFYLESLRGEEVK